MLFGGEGAEMRPNSIDIFDTVGHYGKASGADFSSQERPLFWREGTPDTTPFRFQFYINGQSVLCVADNIRDARTGCPSGVLHGGRVKLCLGLDNIDIPPLSVTPKENLLLDLFFRLLIFTTWFWWRIFLLGVMIFQRLFNALLIVHVKNGRRI